MSKSRRRIRSERHIRLDAVTREFLEQQFQRNIFESMLRRDPANVEVLVQLGDIYTNQGEHEKSLDIDNRLTVLCPQEPNFYYSLACSYSILGRCQESADALSSAVSLGFRDVECLLKNEDLANVRRTEAFQDIVHKLETE